LDATDLDFRVDTRPDEVRRFLETDTASIKVVFSTYQSSPVVSQGAQGLAPFDVAIFDEAHRTTGPQGGLFAHSLSDENIRIRKRLFFTATPRHYDIRHRNKEGDFRIVSMDDETIYGPRAYTLTFGSAARRGIVCNYKVIISVVDSQEINDFALKHGITLVEGDLIRARWVANQIAIDDVGRSDAGGPKSRSVLPMHLPCGVYGARLRTLSGRGSARSVAHRSRESAPTVERRF
jgi:predicted helicase